MWQLVAAVTHAGVAGDWTAALNMPADVAMAILDARGEMLSSEPDEPTTPPQWEDVGGGKLRMPIKSVEQLKMFMRSTQKKVD